MDNFNKDKKRLMFDKKAYSKVYYQKHKEKIKEYSKQYYYDVARKERNIKPRQPKPKLEFIKLDTPITITFD